jgi:hypothetical protein
MRVEDREKKLGNLGFELGYGLNPWKPLSIGRLNSKVQRESEKC